MSRSTRSFSWALPLLFGAWFVPTTPADAQIASALLREGDPLPAAGAGHTVTSIGNTAVNHVGGYAASINSSDGIETLSHIWGNPSGAFGAIMRTEGTFGSLVQTSFESFYGMADDGSLSYSASGTGGPVGGFDSVWLDDTPIAVEGNPYPNIAGLWWRFASRPGVTADGRPYFIGGLTSTQGGSTENRGLFFDVGTFPILLGGDAVPGLPLLLSTANTVNFDYRFSSLAGHYIAEVQMDGTSTSDNAMVIDSQGWMLGGSLVREGNLVPGSVGGDGTENWDNFDFMGITEGAGPDLRGSSDYFFTGDTDGDTTKDEFIVKNGTILYREGDLLDGETLSGSIEGAYMNENGDLGFIWDVQNNALEALYLNNTLLLKDGDPVDLDGDGVIDVGTAVSSFTGIAALTISDQDNTGNINVYFTADIDTAGTSGTTDDVEGYFCMPILAEPTAIQLSGLRATASEVSPGVTVEWTTSAEVNHAGFHVYRNTRINGVYERVNGELLIGRSPYSFVDEGVSSNSTYFYKIGAVDLDGVEILYGPVQVNTPTWGLRFVLAPAEPNPFQRQTQIRFAMRAEAHATLSVFDVTGRRVATLLDGTIDSGDHAITWDGMTDAGAPAAGGVYFYRLETPGLSKTHKLVKLVK